MKKQRTQEEKKSQREQNKLLDQQSSVSSQHSQMNNDSSLDARSTNESLSQQRIILNNLVYVIGLSPQVAHSEILMKNEYFGQYGKIQKIVINKNNALKYKGGNAISYSAYLTFYHQMAAALAIFGVNEFEYQERLIRASFGTTKYCTYFLNNQECPNLDCYYLHKIIKPSEQITQNCLLKKDQYPSDKNNLSDQQKIAINIITKYWAEMQQTISLTEKFKPVFPSALQGLKKIATLENLKLQQSEPEQPVQRENFQKQKMSETTATVNTKKIVIRQTRKQQLYENS